jgi:hypothetical protein
VSFKVGDRVVHLTREPRSFGIVEQIDDKGLVIKWDDNHSSKFYNPDGSMPSFPTPRIRKATPLEKAMK